MTWPSSACKSDSRIHARDSCCRPRHSRSAELPGETGTGIPTDTAQEEGAVVSSSCNGCLVSMERALAGARRPTLSPGRWRSIEELRVLKLGRGRG